MDITSDSHGPGENASNMRLIDPAMAGDNTANASGRRAGVSMHFTSLPSPHGIGNVGTAARNFVEQMHEMGLTYWQFLPIGPTGYANSPYQPLSTFAGNELLIDLNDLVTIGLLESGETSELEGVPENRVDYARVIPAKNALLQIAARRFPCRANDQLKFEYEDFLAENMRPWLDDYALFRVIKTRHDEKPWTAWEPQYRHRDSETLEAVRKENAAQLQALFILQFLFDRQWRSLKQHARGTGICLFGDMPIYIALDSVDAWTNPEMLQMDGKGRPIFVAGVPPDYFTSDGQLWGNPLYDWEYHEAEGFSWWLERMRHATARFDIARIDHFRGFESYWAVPYGQTTAEKGKWKPGPKDKLFEALERDLGSLPIVAEDLGVITPEVEDLRRQFGIPGMKVLQFELAEPDFDPKNMEKDCVCYTGTHDNDTTQGWFHKEPTQRKLRSEWSKIRKSALKVTNGTPETIHRDMIRLAFSTPAKIAIAPMQDFLGLDSGARLNTPGTTSGNWKWRLQPAQLTAEIRNDCRALVESSNRI